MTLVAALFLSFHVLLTGCDCDTPIDPQQTVVVPAGQTFAVSLLSQPGTGFSWNMTVGPDPSVAELVSSTILPPATPRPGATQVQCFVFSAVGAGQTSMQFEYSRPFEPGTPPAQVQTVEVSVEDPA